MKTMSIKKMSIKKAKGFTLIELMIVVAIISIIAAIGYPSYQASVRKGNRADGVNAMLDTAQQLERCFTTYGAYNNANCIANGTKITSPKGHYQVTVTTEASTFILLAEPVSSQQKKDAACTTFTLTNTGKKTATGTDGTNCW